MKIPYTHIKEATKEVDKHNEKRSEQIERHHQSESEGVSKEIAGMVKSEAFKKEMKWDRKHPGHLKKVLQNHYGRKYF